MATIRPAAARDAAALVTLTEELGYPASADETAARLTAILRRTDDVLFVAVTEDDRPIGWLHVSQVATLTEDEHAVLNGLVVADGHRSGGIGARLLDAGERWARDQGLGEIVVRTRVTRARAHRFYEREGYRLVKESRVYAKTL